MRGREMIREAFKMYEVHEGSTENMHYRIIVKGNNILDSGERVKDDGGAL